MTMKKRIISLILVVVMSVLALASCAYSYIGDDMTSYATFDKAAFLAALAEFEVEDGDFTENAETRSQKVIDTIMASLAKKAGTDDKKTEGTVDTYDLIYYCYYVTIGEGAEEQIFYTDKMKESAASSTQLGLSDYSTDFAKKLAEAFAGFEFTAESAYKQVTDGKIKDGDKVFITYTKTYDKVDAEGATATVTENAKLHREVINVAENEFHKALVEYFDAESNKASVGKKISEIKVDTTTYTNITVNWVEQGEAKTFTDKTYTTEKTEAPTYYTGTTATKKDLKDVELTYHVYAVSYVEVADITVESIVNDIYGKSITLANIATIILGDAYTEHEHEDGEEDNSVHKLLEETKFTVEGEEITLEDFVKKLTSAQTKVADTKEANKAAKAKYDKAVTALEEAKKTAAEKQADLDTAKANLAEENTEANQTEVTNAEKALEEANKKVKSAEDDVEETKKAYLGAEATEDTKAEVGTEKEYNDAVAKRDALVTELVATVEGGADAIVNGYKNNVVYKDLESKYNSDIATKVAKYVYEQIIANVKVNSYPKKAVKAAYEYLIDSYEYCFYENYKLDGTSNSSAAESYYSQYGGSFKNFLAQHVAYNEYNIKDATYEQAVEAVEKAAKAHVAEAIAINLVAQTFDLALTKDEFKELTDDNYTYDYYVDLYYEDSFEIIYQFDKLMKELVKSEEKEDGLATLIDYKNDYIGTVKRVEELTEKTETE